MLSTGQANFSEKRWLENFLGNSGSSKPESRTWANTTVPSDRLRACWIESESRLFKFSENILSLRFEEEAAILSITASMVCLLVLIRTRSSDKSLTYPSTLTCLNHLVKTLMGNLTTANGTVGMAYAGKQKTHVIVDFGNGPNCRAGISGSGFLIYGNRRRKPFNCINIWLFHNPKELSGIGGKGFNVPSLPFRINSVESKGTFSTT